MELGYLLHLTHYDPVWVTEKEHEKPFDMKLGMDIIELLAEEGFNTLFIGVSDGVIYKSHPELKRHYSMPMSNLAELVAHARKLGLEIVPKLNFSEGVVNMHSNWMKAPGVAWYEDMDDHEGYLKKAFDCIDEVTEACKPINFFHIGMDEDHSRSYSQYVEMICDLHKGLKERGLRTIIWNDSAISYPNGQVFVEKITNAYDKIPKDIVHIIWTYRRLAPEEQIKTIVSKGFELWGAPGEDEDQIRDFSKALIANNCQGVLVTLWRHCDESNRNKLVDRIRKFGKIWREG